MLAVKSSAGVAPKVNLRNPLHAGNEAYMESILVLKLRAEVSTSRPMFSKIEKKNITTKHGTFPFYSVLKLLHPSYLVSTLKTVLLHLCSGPHGPITKMAFPTSHAGVGERVVITRDEIASVASVASRGEIASSCPRATYPSCHLRT